MSTTTHAMAAETGVSRPADRLFETCLELYAPALERLAAAYEADSDLRRDLLQEIHTQLWRSLRSFDQRCSLRTWTYRVAHNTAASHVARQVKRKASDQAGLEAANSVADPGKTEASLADRESRERLMALVQRLRPLDKQVIVLYLEGLDAGAIAEVTGIPVGSVAAKIHRVKGILSGWFQQGGNRHGRK